MNFIDCSDEELMVELSAFAEMYDTVPELAMTQARASYSMSSPWDTALAQLIYDSANDDHGARALIRSGNLARELTFESPELTVEVEIGRPEEAQRGRCRILGQLVPAQAASIEIRHPNGSMHVDADCLGRFAVDDAPTGPVSLRCLPVNGEPTQTEWTVI